MRPFLFITANDHENNAFQKHFKPSNKSLDYQQGSIKGRKLRLGTFGKYEAAHLHLLEQGPTNPHATLLVHETIRVLNPIAVIMVGIAFGVNEDASSAERKQSIGDVLVSKNILPYDAEKIRTSGSIYKEYPKEAGFQLLNAFSEYQDWTRNSGHKVFVGNILTGSKLVDDYAFREKLLLDFADANPIGGEMEAYGIYSVCRFSGTAEWIIIKGISDWGHSKNLDKNRKTNDQIEAANAAVDYCIHVFSRDNVFDDLVNSKTTVETNTATESDGESFVLYNQGMRYFEQEDYYVALKWLEKSSSIFNKVHGNNSPETATAYESISIAYERLGLHDKAHEWAQKAYQIRKETFRENCLIVATSGKNHITSEGHNTKAPLKIVIIWHKEYRDGEYYAKNVITSFSRNNNDYAGNSIGIPIECHNLPMFNPEEFRKLTNVYEKVACVLLIDASMNQSTEWQSFKSALDEYCGNSKGIVIFPVATRSLEAASNICNTNNINLTRFKYGGKNTSVEFSYNADLLKLTLAHAFCSLLINGRRDKNNCVDCKKKPVQVFISHARSDGKSLARTLKTYISRTPLKPFIDVDELQSGVNFEEEIKKNIHASKLLLILYTDNYSSRNWCQKEVLIAKECGCSVLLLDALETQEVRRFPYGANMKSIHLGHGKVGERRSREIIYDVLLEVLKTEYHSLFLNYSASIHLKEPILKKTLVFKHHPELFTVRNIAKSDVRVALYPEPPLSNSEVEVLREYCPRCLFATPTLLPCISISGDKLDARGFLAGKNIGISIANTADKTTNMLLSTFYLDLIRHLLVADANILYAGNPNYVDENGENYVVQFEKLVKNYCFNFKEKRRIIVHYLKDRKITPNFVNDRCSWSEFIYVPTDRNQSRQKNLTTLRKVSASASDARIVFGGKTSGYSGDYPGIIEEAYIALRHNPTATPLYVIGAFGGAAEILAKWLRGDEHKLENCDKMEAYFKEIGFQNINNGLSYGENIELAICDNASRSIALIIKGLRNTLLYKD